MTHVSLSYCMHKLRPNEELNGVFFNFSLAASPSLCSQLTKAYLTFKMKANVVSKNSELFTEEII